MNMRMDSMRPASRKVSFDLDPAELAVLSMSELNDVFCNLSTIEQILYAMTCQPWLDGDELKSKNGAGKIIDRLHDKFCSFIGLVGDIATAAELQEDNVRAAEVRVYILVKEQADLGSDHFGSTTLMAVQHMHAIGIASDKAAGVRPKGRAA